jgi:hypothetical protein
MDLLILKFDIGVFVKNFFIGVIGNQTFCDIEEAVLHYEAL